MTYINTSVLKKYAGSKGFLLTTGTISHVNGVTQIVWLLRKTNTPELVFDTAWDVLEGLDWLEKNHDEACRFLRKNRAADVWQDSSTVWK